ncbi:unnamed protein product [Pleuronectes platessa]|uniref:Uncharacterized protein n=1 Tax=Pleuronectes platessa TaxID=8262 RepID=A0A9N7UG30_PLEPL|nr:unnamed protein product [Pleuronectes platessa]
MPRNEGEETRRREKQREDEAMRKNEGQQIKSRPPRMEMKHTAENIFFNRSAKCQLASSIVFPSCSQCVLSNRSHTLTPPANQELCVLPVPELQKATKSSCETANGETRYHCLQVILAFGSRSSGDPWSGHKAQTPTATGSRTNEFTPGCSRQARVEVGHDEADLEGADRVAIRSFGVTDKELAFMHEEGIRDPALSVSED